jgi:hypothetical protein
MEAASPISFSEIQSNFDERDSLKREKAYKREVFCLFWLVSQSSADNPEGGKFTRWFSFPLIEIQLHSKKCAGIQRDGAHFFEFPARGLGHPPHLCLPLVGDLLTWPAELKKRKIYAKPNLDLGPLDSHWRQYLEGRGITANTYTRNRIGQTRREDLVFPYIRHGEIVNAKFRKKASKDFYQAKDAEKVDFDFFQNNIWAPNKEFWGYAAWNKTFLWIKSKLQDGQ